MWHDLFVQNLNSSFRRMKEKNPRFSLRAYALKLGISNGMLSDVLNGKARFTKKRASEILERLDVPPKEKTRLMILLGSSQDLAEAMPDLDKFMILSDWNYRSILFSFDIEKFSVTPQVISEKLGLSLADVERRIDKLIRLGLLKIENGGFIRAEKFWAAAPEDSKDFAQALYTSGIEIAQRAVTAVPHERRDFTTITFAGSSDQLDRIRVEIQELSHRIQDIMKESPADEVYQMSILIHPALYKGLVR